MIAAVLTAAIALPVIGVLGALGTNDESGAWQHIYHYTLNKYLTTSALLLGGVLAVSLLIGTSCAWLTATCRFPGAWLFRWSLALPLALPTYVLAYAWTDLLDFSGPVQGWLRAHEFNIGSIFPESRSLTTAIAVLALGLFPYIYLTVWPLFRQQSRRQIEAAQSLGCSAWSAWWRIVLPSARPVLAAGAALVGLETLAEYGAVDHFGLDTFTTGIYRTWTGERSLSAATRLAAMLLVAAVALLTLERLSRRHGEQRAIGQGSTNTGATSRWQLRGWQAWAATCWCALPLFFGFVIPLIRLGYLAVHAILHGHTPASLWQATGTSLSLAISGGFLIVLSSLFLSYCKRLAPGRAALFGSAIARFGYAIPGSVVAVAILVPFAWVDNTILTPAWLWLTDEEWRLPITGTGFILLYAYLVRFTAIGMTAVDGRLQSLPRDP